TVEGGDVHVLGNGAVMIGMGERTTPMAVEMLSQALFRGGEVSVVIAVELPMSRAMMHLDTVMTMVDRGAFVLYPYLDPRPRSRRAQVHDLPDRAGSRLRAAVSRPRPGCRAGPAGSRPSRRPASRAARTPRRPPKSGSGGRPGSGDRTAAGRRAAWP